MEKENKLHETKLIAEFLGYKYYKQVLLDFSDCGGIYEWTDVFSQIPIEVDDYPEDEQCYFKDNFPGENWNKVIYNPNYHEDWNLLILVVEKIEALPNFFVQIEEKSCYIYDISKFTDEQCDNFLRLDGETKLEAVYKAVVEFIKWYNKNGNTK